MVVCSVHLYIGLLNIYLYQTEDLIQLLSMWLFVAECFVKGDY